MLKADITKHYGSSGHGWYGVPKHRVNVRYDDGTKKVFQGTYRSVRCQKLAVQADGRTPTGTLMCNNCARIPTLQSFVSRIKQASRVQHKFLPNKFLSHKHALTKLRHLSEAVRNLRKRVVRSQVRKRTVAAREALKRDDVKKFCKELQFIAQRGTLEDKKVMWSYLQDVVRNEYLLARKGPTGARGMRWSQETKDFATSQKLMAGKRLPQHLRENIGGPSRMTIMRHLQHVRDQVQPGPLGIQANMEAIAAIWKPIIEKRRLTHPQLKVIMVELSEDETGVNSRIEYWREKDSILGSCGYHAEDHKCNDQFHPKIGSSWDRLVDLMRKAVSSTYLRVIMCNPLCDWLQPMTCHLNATCNQFDHVPHVTSQWSKTLEEFDRVLRPLGCNFTGRGSDGDSRRTKLQHELAARLLKMLNRVRAAAVVLQRRWRRAQTVTFVVCQMMRRRQVGTVLRRVSLTFTLPISLEGAHGFTFAVRLMSYDRHKYNFFCCYCYFLFFFHTGKGNV